jgi:quercetin dioxygenase-like cupin family protein
MLAARPEIRPRIAEEMTEMPNTFMSGRAFGRGLVIAGMIAGSVTLTSPASAGECPADKQGANAREPVTFAAKDVTDTVLAATDLADEAPKLKGSKMRVRKLTIQPGGIVPWHSHGERPALIYIIEGEIVEYASNCSVPILHKAGEVARETHVTSHWWKNLGEKTVTLLSFDIMHDEKDHNM